MSGAGYGYSTTVDSVQVGEYTASTKTWAARASLGATCGTWGEPPVPVTQDFVIEADGFGGWKVRE